MAYIVDIIIIAVFFLTVFVSYKKGFVKSLFDLIGTLLAFTAAKIFSGTLAPQGFGMFVEGPARATLSKSLGKIGTTDYGAQVQEAIESIPDGLSGVMQLIGIDKEAILQQVSSSELAQGNLVDTIMSKVVEPVGTAVIQFVLFVILAVAFTVIIRIGVKLLDFVVKKIPVVKKLNSSLGIVVGILRGFLTVIIISMVIGLVVSFIGSEEITEAVNGSVIISSVQSLISSISGAVLK